MPTFVNVYGIDGLPLQISSTYGSPTPASGLAGYAPGSSVTASVASPVEELPGLRRVVTGWTGKGSVPASGTGSTITITLNDISSLTWNWRTEVKLAATAGAGGTVSAPTGDWLEEGTNVVVSAKANPGFVFAGWSGDIASAEPTLNLKLVRPFTIAARFEADSDNDGLPDGWEQSFFGGLTAKPADDPDNDGQNNLSEFRRGTVPNKAETLAVSDGISSRWENVQRDPALPGQIVVRDFGSGFRGAWENSNDYREAVDPTFIGANSTVPGVSFEGPRLIIRTNVWDPAWKDFTASAIFSVGDNDGNCVYFRYQDEMNWYRVTVCGENNNADWRAPFGVTVQKRVKGQFSELLEDASIATDPSDTSFYKRVRVTVTAKGSSFEIRVAGWNAQATPPAWDANTELVTPIVDSDLSSGRFGVGTWGQSGGGPATPTNPVNAGVLIEDVIVSVAGKEVFNEDWEQVPLAAQLPAGWVTAATGSAAGTWQVSADGSIMQTSNYSTTTAGTIAQPKANGESTILLAPTPGVPNYFLELGFHPFDDDGIGFVYDFQDTNNFSRVLFVSETTANGRVPQGVSVSRKAAGVWSDIIAGDNTFVYANGQPFAVEFSSNNGQFRMTARNADDPASIRSFTWTGSPTGATNRFGWTCWGETDAHFLYARAYGLTVPTTGGELRIAKVSIAGANLVLDISNNGGPYAVETSETLAAGSWTVAAQNQSAPQWTTPLRAGAGAVFYRLRRD